MNPPQVANALDTTVSIPIPEVPAVVGPGRIDFGLAGIIMTPEEFDAVTDYDDCYRYELIRGVLVVNPHPSDGEAGPNELLGNLLFLYQESHPNGSVLDGTMQERDIHCNENRRRCDRAIWVGLGRFPNSKVDTPTIVVEFVSPSRRDWNRDYIEKRKEYRDAGVKEYWIIDRFQRCLTVRHYEEKSETEIVVAANEIYRTELLPGFELPMARILKMADNYTPPK